MPDKTTKLLIDAFTRGSKILKEHGLKPKFLRLDNECPQELKELFNKEEIDFKLTPPGINRRNLAERAMQTFKNHFITGLGSTDHN